MNEQLLALAKQVPNWNINGVYLGPYGPSLQAFAELVIKKCAEVASDYDGAHYVGTAVEEYFGIK